MCRQLEGECVWQFLRVSEKKQEEIINIVHSQGVYLVSKDTWFREYLNRRHGRVVL